MQGKRGMHVIWSMRQETLLAVLWQERTCIYRYKGGSVYTKASHKGKWDDPIMMDTSYIS
jgi:hypothetical protein